MFCTVMIVSSCSGNGGAATGPRSGDDVGAAGDRGVLLVAVGGAEGDELVGLEGVDLALRADRVRQQPRPVAAAHDVVADLLARLDLREGEQLGREARGVAVAVGLRAAADRRARRRSRPRRRGRRFRRRARRRRAQGEAERQVRRMAEPSVVRASTSRGAAGSRPTVVSEAGRGSATAPERGGSSNHTQASNCSGSTASL